jgi:hypothetical protein
MFVFFIEGFSGMVFGGIHCLGWNALFPRHVEQTLWRVASIGTAVGMLGVFLYVLVWLHCWICCSHHQSQTGHPNWMGSMIV